MESVFCQILALEDQPTLDCNALLELPCTASDSGYFSASSSLSPASSVDSGCFSPPPSLCGTSLLAAEALIAADVKPEPPSQKQGRSRSRYPGRKRQSASEREKLRMRGLTKALHHLRSYLPPSVAPAGQTLTKIETLRLAIRYIAHLSAQLGLTEHGQNAALERGLSPMHGSMEFQNCYQYSPTAGHWGAEDILGLQMGPTEYPQKHSQLAELSESITGHIDATQAWFQDSTCVATGKRTSPVEPDFHFPASEISDIPLSKMKPSDSCMFTYNTLGIYGAPQYQYAPSEQR